MNKEIKEMIKQKANTYINLTKRNIVRSDYAITIMERYLQALYDTQIITEKEFALESDEINKNILTLTKFNY